MQLKLFILYLIFSLNLCMGFSQEKKGFDLSNSSIPPNQIVDGSPPRDGIPSIDDPKFLKPDKVDFLEPSDRVLGVTYNYISKAYPIKILNWHEVVNDYFGRKPVVISYCPLCGSGMAYEAKIDGAARTFGVSGLLYNNDVLLYDRQSESLWSQIKGEAISGSLKGVELNYIQTTHTTWSNWKKNNPYSQVLSAETGYEWDYEDNLYAAYKEQKRIEFPLTIKDDRYHPKTWTLGVEVDGRYKAYPFEELRKSDGSIVDEFAGMEFTIHFDADNHHAVIKDSKDKEYPSVIMYWFAWKAFHPETEIYTFKE